MKRGLLILILILSAFAFASGQAFTGGITGGFSVNQIDGDEFRGYNMIGYTGGTYIQTNMPGKWQVQGEIKYFLKGAQYIAADNSRVYKEHLNYVQVPVLVNYYVNEKLFPELGISAGYLFLVREDQDGNGFTKPVIPFKPLDLSFEGGMNFQINKSLRANIRLSYSILRIREFPGGQTFLFDRGQYNSSLSFNLYYRILPSLTHSKK
jgi:hypothetical protein